MNSKLDIRPDHLKIVQDILHKHLPRHLKVWVFGSRATWKAKDFSDLDLALDGKEKLSNHIIIDLDFAFEESDLPWKVDLLDVHNTADAFLQAIERDKVPFPLKKGWGMGEWHVLRLSDGIEIIGGGTPKRSEKEYWSGNIPWLSVVDFNSDSRFVSRTV